MGQTTFIINVTSFFYFSNIDTKRKTRNKQVAHVVFVLETVFFINPASLWFRPSASGLVSQ